MTRIPGFSNPLLLGFEELERVLDRATKNTNDGYPPYNIERIANPQDEKGERLVITLAVAGFTGKYSKYWQFHYFAQTTHNTFYSSRWYTSSV